MDEVVSPVVSFCGLVVTLRYLLWRRKTIRENTEFDDIVEVPESVTWVNVESFRVLSAICDTLIPSYNIEDITDDVVSETFSGFYGELGKFLTDDIERLLTTAEGHAYLQYGAINTGTHENVAKALENALYPFNKRELGLVFSLMQTSLGCFILTGMPAPFPHLSMRNRITALHRLRDSYIQPFRAIFQTFRRITTSTFLGHCERGETKPMWNFLNYYPRRSSAKAISNDKLLLTNKLPKIPIPQYNSGEFQPVWKLDADVVIVGSGAGGGVMAHELVKAGLSVIVLEKGSYHGTKDHYQQWGEAEAMSQTLERGGMLGTKDGNIMVLAGSCVGGGTSINWSASFNIPDHVREEWEGFGLKKFSKNGEHVQAFEAINKLMNVNDRFSYRPRSKEDCEGHDDDPNFVVNEVNHFLWDSAKACGLKPERIRRNVKDCVDCGNCLFGCPYGSKQSTVTALLEPLQHEMDEELNTNESPTNHCCGQNSTLKLIPNCFVEKILQRDGEAVGVVGYVDEYDETDSGPFRKPPLRRVKLVVTSKVVVAACGAIHTPALLLRTGLKNRKIGKHLTLHPVVAAATKLPKTALKSDSNEGYRGVGMGIVVKNIERSEDKGWGSAIETPPFHMSIFGAGYFWDSGLQLKAGTISFSKFCPFIAISRDHSQESNCIELDVESGLPLINYVITKQDEMNLLHTLIQGCRVLHAGGAPMCIVLHEHFKPYVVDSSLSPSEEMSRFNAWLDSIQRQGLLASSSQIFSAHQMGSCRMATSPEEGVVTPDCESWELKNLFVADASVFPTALGVNPMITVEAISYMTSRAVMDRLNVKRRDDNSW